MQRLALACCFTPPCIVAGAPESRGNRFAALRSVIGQFASTWSAMCGNGAAAFGLEVQGAGLDMPVLQYETFQIRSTPFPDLFQTCPRPVTG